MKKGFSVIELLIAVSIIGILGSVVIISAGTFRTEARDTARIKDLRTLEELLNIYALENPGEGWPDNIVTGSNELFLEWNNNAYGGGLLWSTLGVSQTELPRDPQNDLGHLYWYRKCSQGNCCNPATDPTCNPTAGDGVLIAVLENSENLPDCSTAVQADFCSEFFPTGCIQAGQTFIGTQPFNDIAIACIAE
ncbi:hypothetical protein CL654_00335 [bacterium]|nr:hypothetical protein [bacterium]|tara:strand:- start:6969 stop:7547 length:579 start_codon:yes stop_codon:yes gene_type:complete